MWTMQTRSRRARTRALQGGSTPYIDAHGLSRTKEEAHPHRNALQKDGLGLLMLDGQVD
jgi:hypothetical protein